MSQCAPGSHSGSAAQIDGHAGALCVAPPAQRCATKKPQSFATVSAVQPLSSGTPATVPQMKSTHEAAPVVPWQVAAESQTEMKPPDTGQSEAALQQMPPSQQKPLSQCPPPQSVSSSHVPPSTTSSMHAPSSQCAVAAQSESSSAPVESVQAVAQRVPVLPPPSHA